MLVILIDQAVIMTKDLEQELFLNLNLPKHQDGCSHYYF